MEDEDELELLLDVEEDDGVLEVVKDALLEVVELVVLEEENTTKAPTAIIAITTTAPITSGVETPRLVRMWFTEYQL